MFIIIDLVHKEAPAFRSQLPGQEVALGGWPCLQWECWAIMVMRLLLACLLDSTAGQGRSSSAEHMGMCRCGLLNGGSLVVVLGEEDPASP